MSDYPSAQFVSAPSASAMVRYDFNVTDAAVRCHLLGAGDLDLGVPTYDGEPEGVGAEYGYRQLRFVQRIQATKAVAFGRQSALARELMRPTNWLRFQWSATTAAVYFKTYRGEPGSLSVEHGDTANAWDISVSLVADSFAYGPRQTLLSGISVVQAPSGTNALRVTLPAIKGDAPAPLRVRLAPTSASPGNYSTWRMALSSSLTALSAPVVDIGTGDGLTAGTNTGAGVSSANYFGGSYRQASIAAGDAAGGTNNFSQRLSGTFTGLMGSYRVLLRCEADSPSTVGKNFVFYATVGNISGRKTPLSLGDSTSPAQTFQGFMDLGVFTLPPGRNLSAGLEGTPPSVVWSLTIGTSDNSAATVRMDALVLIPVDDGNGARLDSLTAYFRNQNQIYSGLTGIFDGDSESYGAINSGGAAVLGVPNSLTGGFLRVDPAMPQNVFYLLATCNSITGTTTGTTASLNASTVVDLSYYPRYLHIGDGN